MSDEGSLIALGAGITIVSREVVLKLLGPTADYLGTGALSVAKKCEANIARIYRLAADKIGSKIDEPGAVNARVLKNVWDEGRFIEDSLATEYFAGLLASARTANGEDDSAIAFVALIKSLSSFQLRLHFIIYSLITKHPVSSRRGTSFRKWRSTRIAIDGAELLRAMDVTGPTGEDHVIFALSGLVDHGLVEKDVSFRLGSLREQDSTDAATTADYIAVVPTDRGARLFLRAVGLKGVSPDVIGSLTEYNVSEHIRTEVKLPTDVTMRQIPEDESVEHVIDELKDRIDDLENSASDLDGRLDDLENKKVAETIKQSSTRRAVQVATQPTSAPKPKPKSKPKPKKTSRKPRRKDV